MTSQNEARQVIYSTFDTGMSAAHPGLPLTLANEAFDTENITEYVRCSVKQTPGGQETLGGPGNRVFRRRGLVAVQIFTAVDKGLLRFDELSATVLDILEAKTISGVSLYDGNAREVGDFGKFHQGTVVISFDYDETK